MTTQNTSIKRVCFYTLYNKNGILREYVKVYLSGLKKICNKVIVIVNGFLSEDGNRWLYENSFIVLKRENFGLDFGAWKDGIEYVGWERLSLYDELIFTNCSVYGPVFPFSSVFDKMDKIKCDFWGLTIHKENVNKTVVQDDPTTYVRRHIQTYFLVVRKKLHLSMVFKEWWRGLKKSNNYEDEVLSHEIGFTVFFEKHGYVAASYYESQTNKDPTLSESIDLIKAGVPIIKRKLFTNPFYVQFGNSNCTAPSELLKYIEQIYDTNIIYDDLLAENAYSSIFTNLPLHYILPSKTIINEIECNKKLKVCVVVYAFYEDEAIGMAKYLKNFDRDTKIIVISTKQEVLKKYEELITNLYKCVFVLKSNRGRDASAYLVSAREYFKNFEIVYFLKDKKSPQQSILHSQAFEKHCLDSICFSREYIQNTISCFIKNKRLGMLIPPTVYFGGFTTIGDEPGICLQGIKDLHSKLKFTSPVDPCPLAPFGSIFCARVEALTPIFRKKWTDLDFPEEPLPIDGALNHVIERFWPMVVQESGFLTGFVIPEEYACIYYNNIYTCLRETNQAINNLIGTKPHQSKIEILNSAKYIDINTDKVKLLKRLLLSFISKRYQKKLKFIL